MVSNTATFLTPAEVGKILKVTPQTVRAMCERGELDHIRIGTGKRTTYRIQRRFLDRLMHRTDAAIQAPEHVVTHDRSNSLVDDEEYIKNWMKK